MKITLYLLPAISLFLFLFSTFISSVYTWKKSNYQADPLQYHDPEGLENFNTIVLLCLGLFNLFLNLVSIYFISATIYLVGELIKKLNR